MRRGNEINPNKYRKQEERRHITRFTSLSGLTLVALTACSQATDVTSPDPPVTATGIYAGFDTSIYPGDAAMLAWIKSPVALCVAGLLPPGTMSQGHELGRATLDIADDGLGPDCDLPTDIGFAFANMWQGILDTDQTWGGITLHIDVDISDRRSPSAP